MSAQKIPTHEELLARGAQYLGDGVYAEETPEGIQLTGNAYGRHNVVFLAGNEYAALRKFAQASGYATEQDRKLLEHVERCPFAPASTLTWAAIIARPTTNEAMVRWLAELRRLVGVP